MNDKDLIKICEKGNVTFFMIAAILGWGAIAYLIIRYVIKR